MHRLSLRSSLIAFHLAAVVLAVAVVGIGGFALLRNVADEQALARVRTASANGAVAIERGGQHLSRASLLLAQRPTLGRLLAQADEAELTPFLSDFLATGDLAGYLVTAPGRRPVAGGWPENGGDGREAGPLWSEIIDGMAGCSGPGACWRLLEISTGAVLLAAQAEIAGFPGGRVLVCLPLDAGFSAEVGKSVGLPVTILARGRIDAHAAGPFAPLSFRALGGEKGAAGKLSRPDVFASASPIVDGSGIAAGVVETRLPAALAGPPLGRLARGLIALACAAAILAAVLGSLLARNIARPIEELTRAAVRIGGGDFTSPVSPGTGLEMGTLAGAMEEMRGRMLALSTEQRRGQAEAEAVLAGIVEGVYAVGRARRIRYLNPQAAALLGIRPEDAIGRFCGDVLNPRGPGGKRPCEESCPIVHARFRGSARAIEELQLPGGRRRTVVITSSPAGPAGEDGTGHQFQVFRDETEIETSRRLRDSVLANISHEFRTPLSAQLASLELLLDRLDELEPNALRELVCSAQRGTVRLTRLVDNLLESTRIEAGEEGLRRQPVALDEVVEEAVELMAPLLEQREQTLQVHLPHPLPTITGDGPRLVQVFVNLLANANKFAPAGSEITIGGRLSETEVELWVADQGPGLPAGMGEEIFQRFTRARDGEPEAGGMGLGLFIVKSIVDRHGGRVAAESNSHGTRMRVILSRQERVS